jgi:5'-methylthioadenosine phosphorylase
MRVAIIGGTGLYDTSFLQDPQEKIIDTEYGQTKVYIGKSGNREIVFLPRHGIKHSALAYQVNYHANMKALEQLGIRRAIAMNAVGSLNPDMKVGDLVLIDQFMDFAWNRDSSFGQHSVNMTNPYCPELRQNFIDAAKELEIQMHERGNYICTGGPRYETALEVRVFRNWGMDVVGMTNSTEATLARELGICYSTVNLVTDMAAGLTEVEPDLAMHRGVVKENIEKLKKLLFTTAMKVEANEDCVCQELYRKAVEARKK